MKNITFSVTQKKDNDMTVIDSGERSVNDTTSSAVEFVPATKPPLGSYTPNFKDLEQECLNFLYHVGYSTGEDLEPGEDASYVEFYARAIDNKTGGEGVIGKTSGKKIVGLNLNNEYRNLGSLGKPLLRQLHEYQLLGYDIYFVVNGQGNSEKKVDFGKCFYFEIDKDENGEIIPLADQYSYALKLMGGREPSVTLHTGGKSLHFYYRLDEPLPKQNWKPLQRDLIDYIGYSDDAIKDICRVMRLPGFHYKGTENVSSIYQFSDNSYSYEELRKFIPQNKNKKSTKTTSKNKSVYKINNGDIEKFAKRALRGTYYDLWTNKQNIKDGEQNTNLYSLVCEIIGNVQAKAYSKKDGYTLALAYMNSFENFNSDDPWTEDHLKTMWDREIKEEKEGYYTTDGKSSTNDAASYESVTDLFRSCGSGEQNTILKNLLCNDCDLTNPNNYSSLIFRCDETPIRYNILTGCTEILGEPLEIPVALKLLEDKTDLHVYENKFSRFVDGEAYENKYNPVVDKILHNIIRHLGEEKILDSDYMESNFCKEFLDQLRDYYNLYVNAFKRESKANTHVAFTDIFSPLPPLESIKDFLQQSLNITDKWYLDAGKKFLISAVARAFEPGCKSDDVLILRSTDQGLFKSTFFEEIAYKDYYTVKTGNDVVSKDSIEGLYRGWIHEIDEIERVSRTVESSDTKSFLSKSHDNYRAPYEKQSLNRPRHWVLCGSSNADVLFLDTQNRRYNVIEINQTIDIDYVKEYRDSMWALVALAYLNGEKWYYHVNDEGAKIRKERNEQYKVVDDNLSTYAGLLANTKSISTTDFIDLLDAQRPQDKMTQVKAGRVFSELGWSKKRVTQNGVRTWVFVKPEASII